MKKQFLMLSSLRFVKLSLSFLAMILYARTFGIGIQMDSWVFASGAAASVGMALWGPLNEIIRSRYVCQVAEAGEESARASAKSLLVFTSTSSVLLCFILYIGAPQIIDMLYAENDPVAQALVLKLFVLMLPTIVIGQVLSLGTAYMNCYDVIYPPELLGLASAVLNVTCVLVLTPFVGIYSLVCGYYLGVALSLVVVLRFMRSSGILYRTVDLQAIFRDARAATLFAAPLFFSYGAGQLNSLFEKYLASLMGVGVVSSVNYSSQIKSTLQAVLTSVMFSLIVPRLTRTAYQQEGEAFKHMFAESQRVAMVFLLAVLPFVFGTADTLAAILFGKKLMSASTLEEIALLIRLYAAALVPVILYVVYGVALLAQQKGREYAALGVAAQLLSALICVSLFKILGPTVFPIALLLSHLTAALMMLRRIDIQRRWLLFSNASGYIALITVAAVGVMFVHDKLTKVCHSIYIVMAALMLAYGLAILIVFFFNRSKKASI